MTLLITLFAAGTASAQDAAPSPREQEPREEDIGTRGAFLSTRPSGNSAPRTNNPSGGTTTAKPASGKPAENTASDRRDTDPKSGKNNRKDRKKGSGGGDVTVANANPKIKKGPANPNSPSESPRPVSEQASSFTTASFSPEAIGIGYTLYMRDANGDALRVDPKRVFHSGESVRLAVESNTDGYLYVFHTENDKDPQMIFPDARLGRGNNFIRAHVPYEVPSNMESDERLRWFVFDGTQAAEKLYIVLTRQPLPEVPTGETLVKFCQSEGNTCPWGPPRAVWDQLKGTNDREQVAVSRVKDEGRAQTNVEREAATRGLGLSQDAPGPSVIRMTASSKTGVLVTAIELVHEK
ncbi:MAG: DUF4384 domain-containing protein [Pyrinomonadaceae bacterium]